MLRKQMLNYKVNKTTDGYTVIKLETAGDKTEEKGVYKITLSGDRCTCPGFEYRRTCKHLDLIKSNKSQIKELKEAVGKLKPLPFIEAMNKTQEFIKTLKNKVQKVREHEETYIRELNGAVAYVKLVAYDPETTALLNEAGAQAGRKVSIIDFDYQGLLVKVFFADSEEKFEVI